MSDSVNHPTHYTRHPSGVECIDVAEFMNFCLGNAIKYIWRADEKNGVEDLKKAVWYLEREISRRTREKTVIETPEEPCFGISPENVYDEQASGKLTAWDESLVEATRKEKK